MEIAAQTDWTETLQASLCFRRVKETSPYPTPPKQESKDFPERIFILSNRVFRIWACNKKRILVYHLHVFQRLVIIACVTSLKEDLDTSDSAFCYGFLDS